MRTIAVIVNLDRPADTMACICSLRESDISPFAVIVVDNGSQPALELSTDDPGVELIRLEENRGFTGGYNVGIRRALALGADAVLVLNNDTLADPALLGRLTDHLQPPVGIVAPRIFYADDPQRIWADGFGVQPFTLEMRGGRRGQIAIPRHEAPRSVAYVTGCAMLIDCRVLKAVGVFDEAFFAYYEDLDYCIRVRRAGWTILNVPEARLWHKVAASTGLGTPRRQYLMAYSSVLFFAKHAQWRAPFVLAARFGSLALTIGRLLSRRRSDLLRAHLRGLRDGLKYVFSQ